MRFAPVLLLFLLLFIVRMASADSYDSLKVLLSKSKTDSVSARYCHEIAATLEAKSPDEADQYIKQAYSLIVSLPDSKRKRSLLADNTYRRGMYFFSKNILNAADSCFSLSLKAGEKINDTLVMISALGGKSLICRSEKNRKKEREFLQQALNLANLSGNIRREGKCWYRTGESWEAEGEYEKAIESYSKVITLYEKLGDNLEISRLLNRIGNMYKFQAEYDKALDYYQKSQKLSQKIKNYSGEALTYIGIANVFMNNKEYDKAIENYKECVRLSEKIGFNKGIAAGNVGMGNVLKEKKEFLKAIDCHFKAKEIYEKDKDVEGVALCLLNTADVYVELNQFNKALEMYQQALNLMEQEGNKIRTNLILYQMGEVYYTRGEIASAVSHFERSLAIAREINYNQTVLADLEALSRAAADQGDFRKAYKYFREYESLKDSVYNDEKSRTITEMQTKYETDKKEKEIALLNKDKELSAVQLEKKEAEVKSQRIIIYSFILGVILILVFSFMVYRQYREKKRANVLLAFKNEEITQQKEEIQAQRDEIEAQRDMVSNQMKEIETIYHELSDSINYALRIQSSVLPQTDNLNQIFKEHFILFKPRDVVSGDFYWAAKVGKRIVFTAADCTGHGVPGAFMSMLCISFLNEVITNEKTIEADAILNEAREYVVRSLQQRGISGEQKDGMDLALCSINTETLEMQYAGANNPCWIVRKLNGLPELIILDPDKMPVAIHESMRPFSKKTFQLQKGDMIYLASDGYEDQFGGPDGKKFKARKLRELLISVSQLPVNEQKKLLSEKFIAWKGDLFQVDDVVLMGVRID